jgi:hypothetical protein
MSNKLTVPFVGKESILTAYETQAKMPYFSIWLNNAPIYSFSGDSKEEGAEMLETILENYSKVDQVFTVRLHNALPAKNDTYNKNEAAASILYCSLVDPLPIIAATGVDPNLSLIMQRLNAIESDIKAQSVNIEEEEEEEEDKNEKLLGQINGIVNSPIIGLLLDFLKPKQTVTHLAGVEDSEIEQILLTLYSKGVTVSHLKKLSLYPKDKIEMLLNLL